MDGLRLRDQLRSDRRVHAGIVEQSVHPTRVRGHAERKVYEDAGYELPKIVFWNLDSHMGTPAECDDDSVAMVSGYSPSIMKAVLNAENFTPMDVMLEALKDIELNYINLPEDFSYVSEI